MFFKKQAFKLKDLLKEQGIEVPLVTVQEMLAKSYGFSNRHVALTATEFHTKLDQIKVNKTADKVTEVAYGVPLTPIDKMPSFLNKDNIKLLSFWWTDDHQNEPVHYPTTSPCCPFEEDFFNLDLEVYLYEQHSDGFIRFTDVSYKYNRKTQQFETNNFNTNKDTPLDQLPYKINQKNISQFRFWWKSNGAEQAVHYPTTIQNSPFGDDDFEENLEFDIYQENGSKNLKKTYVKYSYSKEGQCFFRNNVVKNFLKMKGSKSISFKTFAETDLTTDVVHDLMAAAYDWGDEIKRVLLHKDCPVEYLKKYANSTEFYERITAIFGKYHRNELAPIGKIDPDPRVRAVYYNYLIDIGTDIEEIRRLIKADPKVIKMMSRTTISTGNGDEVIHLINW